MHWCHEFGVELWLFSHYFIPSFRFDHQNSISSMEKILFSSSGGSPKLYHNFLLDLTYDLIMICEILSSIFSSSTFFYMTFSIHPLSLTHKPIDKLYYSVFQLNELLTLIVTPTSNWNWIQWEENVLMMCTEQKKKSQQQQQTFCTAQENSILYYAEGKEPDVERVMP